MKNIIKELLHYKILIIINKLLNIYKVKKKKYHKIIS